MIISFEFRNHRSYREAQTFSMERPDAYKYAQDSIEVSGGEIFSRVAVLYGANASGKSAFIDALSFLRDKAIGGSKERNLLRPQKGWNPFRLQKEWKNSSSEYSLAFVAEDKRKYQYDLHYDTQGVNFESLLVWNSQKPAMLFERGRGDDGETYYNFGGSFTSKNIRNAIKNETKISDITTLLSILKQFDEIVTKPVYDFFEKDLMFYDSDLYYISDPTKRLIRDETLLDVLNTLLPAVDFGISGLKIVEPDDQSIQMLLERNIYSNRDEVVHNSSSLQFKHGGVDAEAEFGRRDESKGTVATLLFLIFMYDALRRGATLVVDELDSSLHPILVSKLVEVFNSKKSNPHGAQLIFTTHDISLIENYEDGEVLDRDQIWFTEKEKSGSSRIYSLLDLDDLPREGSNIGLKYIHGRYGATPNISLFDKIVQLNLDDRDS